MRTFVQWLEGSSDGKKRLFVLVGPPSVGKSTWIRNTFAHEPYVINRDAIAEDVAGGMQLTYDDMFMAPPSDATLGENHPKYGQVVVSPAFMTWQPLSYDKILQANGTINAMLRRRIEGAVGSGQDIVVDMTNMNAKSRKNALEAVKGHEGEFQKVAVVFPFHGSEDFIKRVAAKRAQDVKDAGGSKTIPDAAFDRMFSSFEEVRPEEGFDEVVMYDNRDVLRSLAQG
jgi:predicted kinase